MLGLCPDRVVLRHGVVLNPHYKTMGLYGSEYWTYLLPRRVGEVTSQTLTSRCLPISGEEAIRMGLADLSFPGDPAQFDRAVLRYAANLATGTCYDQQLSAKRVTRHAHEQHRPLHTYRSAELDQMRLDIFADRHGFADARQRFLRLTGTSSTNR
jgi:putative two-component system hydrogenase maturation factor HypX/HoxX